MWVKNTFFHIANLVNNFKIKAKDVIRTKFVALDGFRQFSVYPPPAVVSYQVPS